MNQMNQIVVDILGVDHPVARRVMNGDPALEVTEVFGATLGMMMAEMHDLNNRIEKLEEQNGS